MLSKAQNQMMNIKKAILDQRVIELKNIGEKLASRLNEIGVTTGVDLKKMGAAEAYKRINPDIVPECSRVAENQYKTTSY